VSYFQVFPDAPTKLWKSSPSWRSTGKRIARGVIKAHFGEFLDPPMFNGKMGFNSDDLFITVAKNVAELVEGCRFTRYRANDGVSLSSISNKYSHLLRNRISTSLTPSSRIFGAGSFSEFRANVAETRFISISRPVCSKSISWRSMSPLASPSLVPGYLAILH
jgi:hypothetical protein